VRRESSTVLVLVGELGEGLLAELGRSFNVSVIGAAVAGASAGSGGGVGSGRAGTGSTGLAGGGGRAGTGTGGRAGAGTGGRAGAGGAGRAGAEEAAARAGWEAGALGLREAARRQSAYVVVADDPLAGVAAGWRAMWNVASGPEGAGEFEAQAAQALAAWRDKRFELPDYYLVVTGPEAEVSGPDLYLGPLRAVRPRRIAVASVTYLAGAVQADRVLDALRSLEHGPWWPPLDELIDTARHFYAGGLAETQASPL
jgi:hypothetical protein